MAKITITIEDAPEVATGGVAIIPLSDRDLSKVKESDMTAAEYVACCIMGYAATKLGKRFNPQEDSDEDSRH